MFNRALWTDFSFCEKRVTSIICYSRSEAVLEFRKYLNNLFSDEYKHV